ncbi:hypothetical protein [Bacillus sp. 165]|uniref:hypothetical protein n=1 Tax=Bacillus sp. 165 TaxID=1529117 RepID=UPI001FFE250B|nr:hypothetical protein [Bacillus sp. 165]
MERLHKNKQNVTFVSYEEIDFSIIQRLNEKEGWLSFIQRQENTKYAWKHSPIA